MTREQLDAIRARVEAAKSWRPFTGSVDDIIFGQHALKDVPALLAEVERLKGDRSEVDTAKLNDAFTEGTLKAGDAMRPLVAAAFKRGVAAMREATADLFEGATDKAGLAKMPAWAEFIRALPDPEDTE